MTRSTYSLLLFAIVLPLVGCSGSSPKHEISERNKVVDVVKALGNGRQTDEDFKRNVASLQELARHPDLAVQILVEELKPVSIVKLDDPTNSPIENESARHVIWRFRALYYVTGHKILASSSYKLTNSDYDRNRSGLLKTEGGEWAFFTEWMSRGTVYFAPIDAQKKIIQDWHTWANENLKTRTFPQNVAFDEWYFGGPE